MNAKSLRVLIRALKGRSLKTVAAAEPDAIAWHLAGSVPSHGFMRRGLPQNMRRVDYGFHAFQVRKGPVKGVVTVGYNPVPHPVSGVAEGAEIASVASRSRDSMDYPVPLDLGVKNYRRLFKGIRSALGVSPGTEVKFTRALNIFNPASRRYIKRESSSVKLR